MGLMRVVNLAHGAFAMLGGFFARVSRSAWACRSHWAALLSILLVSVLAIVFERLLLRRFLSAHRLDQMLVTIGLMFVATAAANLILDRP